MPQTAQQAAESVFTLFFPTFSPAALEEYGVEATADQRPLITREILSLNLFWAHHALLSVLSKVEGERVFDELCRYVRAAWETMLGLEPAALAGYFEEAAARRALYDQIVQEGGSPIAVFTEAAAMAESDGTIQPEDRQKFLAFLIDLIPVEAIGETVEGLDLTHK
nr:hypothetical protein [Nitrospirota bacterium]